MRRFDSIIVRKLDHDAFRPTCAIPYNGIPDSEIKKFWTGKSNATKEMMIEHAEARGFMPNDDNGASALALLHLKMPRQEVKRSA